MPRNRTRRRSESNAATSAVTPTPPRSKAGCWTCRIRRKRCDETQDDTGACLACKRLDIECLGWGTKRPEWYVILLIIAIGSNFFGSFFILGAAIKKHSINTNYLSRGNFARGLAHVHPLHLLEVSPV